MAVSILLSDGTVGEIELLPSQHLSQFDALPIQLVPLEPYADNVINSFVNAAFSAYRLLTEKQLWDGRPRAFAYCIKDENGEGVAGQLIGESGGLGMALALIIHILRDSTEGVSVGGTGVILNPKDGEIGPVDYLSEKLQGAIEALPHESRIYHPRANKIDESSLKALRAEAAEKATVLTPVCTLEEAARDFLPPRKRRWWWALLKVAFSCLILLSLYLLYLYVSYPGALYLLETGKYDAAGFHLDVGTRLFPWHQGLCRLRNDLKQRFDVKVTLCYLFEDGVESQHLVSRAHRGKDLGSGDSYAFRLIPSAQVYIYLLQIDSLDEASTLFPSSENSSLSNPLEGRKTYHIPDKFPWLPPSGCQGVMDTYLVMSRWRCKDLEQALYSDKENPTMHVRKPELELMINKRARSGFGSHVERLRFWYR